MATVTVVSICMQSNAELSRYVAPFVGSKTQFLATSLGGKDALHQPFISQLGATISGDATIARYLLCSCAPSSSQLHQLYPSDPWLAAQVDVWLDLYTAVIEGGNGEEVLTLANKHLLDKNFIVGHSLTAADVAVFLLAKKDKTPHPAFTSLARWTAFITPQLKPPAGITKTAPSSGAAGDGGKGGKAGGKEGKPNGGAKEASKGKDGNANARKAAANDEEADEGGTFLHLEGAEDGKVCTRFPPEPSGYLHIGHAKAVLLNQYYAQRYKGRLLVRFDDTNPSKEKEEFEDNIIQDLATLNVVADKVSHTSDHFPACEELARKLIRDGKGYMDNTDQETMQAERMARTESRLRNSSVEENLAIFDQLLRGDESAKGFCLRAKIDMASVNGCLRDPVMYRGNDTPHHRTGTTHKAYPTYDFACPIVDSVEGVSHALRTTEYNDRDEQYHWVQAALELPHRTKIQAFGKMNFVHTCLSKRKLAWFVENNLVEGWFDPRFPTIQGCIRRGVTVEGLKGFILSQGASRRIITMEWDKFWAENKTVLETAAHRFMGVNTPHEVTLTLTNVSSEVTEHSTPLLPQMPEKGSRTILRLNKLLLDQADAQCIKEGEQVTLLRWGNATVTKIVREDAPAGQGQAQGRVVSMEAEFNADSTDFKKTKKYTWLAATPDVVPATIVDFDYLISKHRLEDGDDFADHLNKNTRTETRAIVDPCFRAVEKGAIVQLERMGFYRVDSPFPNLTLFKIPDGKARCCATGK